MTHYDAASKGGGRLAVPQRAQQKDKIARFMQYVFAAARDESDIADYYSLQLTTRQDDRLGKPASGDPDNHLVHLEGSLRFETYDEMSEESIEVGRLAGHFLNVTRVLDNPEAGSIFEILDCSSADELEQYESLFDGNSFSSAVERLCADAFPLLCLPLR